mgnify:CR=1 FL=1
MELIIELPGRGSQGQELQKFSGRQITVGRALDNDLILTDPHICAHHAVLETDDEGNILVRDLGSVNGTMVNKQKYINDAFAIESGDEVQFGKTRLIVYQPGHEVPASIRLSWVEQLALLAGKPLLAAGLSLLLLLMTMYSQYAGEIAEYKPGRELLTGIGVLMLFALWPTAWSLFARYKKHEARFLSQLSTTLAFVVLMTVLEKLDAWLAFHNGASMFVDVIMLVISIAMVLLLIWFHYYLSIFLGSKRRWLYSAAMTALLGSIIYVGSTIDNDSFSSRPEYTASLFPPSLSFYSTESSQAFLDKAATIFEAAGEQAGFEAEPAL